MRSALQRNRRCQSPPFSIPSWRRTLSRRKSTSRGHLHWVVANSGPRLSERNCREYKLPISDDVGFPRLQEGPSIPDLHVCNRPFQHILETHGPAIAKGMWGKPQGLAAKVLEQYGQFVVQTLHHLKWRSSYVTRASHWPVGCPTFAS